MIIQENEIVWSNLSSCLQEAIMIWYHDHLNNIKKTELKSDLNLWYEIALSGPTRKPDPTRPEPGQDPASGAHGLKSIPDGLIGS